MAQIRWTLIYLAQGLGLCVAAALVFHLMGNWSAASGIQAFDADPACRAERLLHPDAGAAGARGPAACRVQKVTVMAEHHSVGGGRGNPLPSVTLLLASGEQRTVRLTRSDAIFAIKVGEQINALVFGDRAALLAVNGQAVSTSDDPEVAHYLMMVRIVVCSLLALGALCFFILAWVSTARLLRASGAARVPRARTRELQAGERGSP